MSAITLGCLEFSLSTITQGNPTGNRRFQISNIGLLQSENIDSTGHYYKFWMYYKLLIR